LVWANNYTRVLQTAKAFVQGYLGFSTATNGSVISVTSTGFPGAIGDSLSPSDQCPNFLDTSGANYTAIWDAIWQPPVQERLQALIEGNLTILTTDVDQMPYLCGFETHILGRLSPWCDVFTDEELKQYEYEQDLRYYYGLGPGTDVPKKMMMPFLNSLVGLLAQGPNITGTHTDGSIFNVPNLIMSFLNDGQLTELVTASGVFDNQTPLSATEKDDDRLFIASHFVSMRGTVAFERLNCIVSPDSGSSSSSGYPNATISTSGYFNTTASTPSTRQACGGKPNPTTLTTAARDSSSSAPASTSAAAVTSAPSYPTFQRRQASNATYIRIRVNDAVYPVPSCQSGPGSSCLLSDYVEYIQEKYEAEGDWLTNCNVTTEGAPTKVEGASFFTDLSSPWLQSIPPY
jgi:acid phosphatase